MFITLDHQLSSFGNKQFTGSKKTVRDPRLISVQLDACKYNSPF